MLGLPAIAFLLVAFSPVVQAEPGTFEVGGFWQPPTKPVDANTDAVWAAIARASFDVVLAQRLGGPHGIVLNKADNETGIAFSHKHGVKLLLTDSAMPSAAYTVADYDALAKAIAPYQKDPRVGGLVLRDEPFPFEMEGVANAYREAKRLAPALRFNVNLLGISAAAWMKPPIGKLIVSSAGATGASGFLGAGSGVLNRFGQTLVIPPGETFLEGLEIQVDPTSFTADEILNLRVWTSPGRTQLLAESQLRGYAQFRAFEESWKNYPYFRLRVPVLPGGEYYIELTHGGGGDRRILVGAGSADVYPKGALYLDGQRQPGELWFRAYGKPRNYGSDYENYVDQWLDISGADSVEYDFYPFRRGTGELPEHYLNAEIIRDRALAVGATYGAYLQVTEVRDVAGNVSIRSPTLNEARYLAYGLLAYGFRKLIWFTYWLPDPAGGEVFANAPISPQGVPGPMYQTVSAINAELRQLGRTLKKLTSWEVFHSGNALPVGTRALPAGYFVRPANAASPFVFGHFKDPDGRAYVMLSLRDYRNGAAASFVLWPKPAEVYEVSKRDGGLSKVPTYDPDTGMLTLDFLAGEGRLLALPKGYSPVENLARGAALTAGSSVENTQDGWGIGRLNDGLGPTYAAAGGYSSEDHLGETHREWVQFDLGARKTVRQVNLFPMAKAGKPSQGFPREIVISVSPDGVRFEPALSWSGQAPVGPDPVCAIFDSDRPARFVRVEGAALARIENEAGRPYRMQFAEVELHARPNFARCARIAASSSVEVSGWGVDKLRDGIRHSEATSAGYSSAGETGKNHPEFLTFDLGVPRLVREVVLFPRHAPGVVGEGLPLDVVVSVSDDQSVWRTVSLARSLHALRGEPKTLRFPVETTRFVKIEGARLRPLEVEAARPHRMQFAEVEIR